MAGGIIAKQVAQEVIAGTPQLLYLGGTDPSGSDAPISISSGKVANLATTTTIGGNPVASQNYANSLLASYVVTGSAVTSIDFSGLDINTHKSYKVEIDFKNAVSSACDIYIFVNGDFTVTNYWTQQLYGAGLNAGASRFNTPGIVYAEGLTQSNMIADISLISGALFSCVSRFAYSSPSTIQENFRATKKTATVTNITQLTFTASVANSIGVGSTIRIYRGDV